MKIQILSIALLFSGIAVAKDINVQCVPNMAGVFANTFSGNGSISFDNSGELSNATGRMTLSLETSDKKKTVVHEFDGVVEVLKAGEFMSIESYSVDMTSKDKSINVKMFLYGPALQSTARVIYKGIDFRSVCNSVE